MFTFVFVNHSVSKYAELEESSFKLAVFRIRAILSQIRIRILGPVHWVTDPDLDPDPVLFLGCFQETNKICLLLTEGTFPSVFKLTKSHKTVEN